MIVQIKGEVNFTITLDPTVWIFDKRKIAFKDLFDPNKQKQRNIERNKHREKSFNGKKQPVDEHFERESEEQLLSNSYAMPIEEFLNHAEIKEEANYAIIKTSFGEEKITLDQLKDCYLLFSYEGKPLTDDGPVHLYFKDGSNKDDPIKGVQEIILHA